MKKKKSQEEEIAVANVDDGQPGYGRRFASPPSGPPVIGLVPDVLFAHLCVEQSAGESVDAIELEPGHEHRRLLSSSLHCPFLLAGLEVEALLIRQMNLHSVHRVHVVFHRELEETPTCLLRTQVPAVQIRLDFVLDDDIRAVVSLVNILIHVFNATNT